MYYGQFNPPVDWLIERFFPEKYVGHCVEVGAVDGVHLSNTLYFEQRGWGCLCIEPNSYYHEALAKNRKVAMPFAVSNQNKDGVVLHRVQMGEGFGACTSLVPDQKLIDQHEHLITAFDQILVNTRTLDWCLSCFEWPKIDFVAIDTEGTELAVLEGFNLDHWKPSLLIIENNHDDPEITQHLRPRGYQKVIRYEVNDFYVRID